MSGSVNKVIIVGNLGRDPEARSFQNGGEIVRLNIATSESWKDRASGEKKERTEWHNVIVQAEGLVKVAKAHLRKGSKVYVEGQLQTRKWTDDKGVERWATDVVVPPFRGVLVLLDRPAGGRDDLSGYAGDDRGPGPAGGGGERADLDDDVPF